MDRDFLNTTAESPENENWDVVEALKAKERAALNEAKQQEPINFVVTAETPDAMLPATDVPVIPPELLAQTEQFNAPQFEADEPATPTEFLSSQKAQLAAEMPNAPTELLQSQTAQFDPLTDAEQLPSLFPQAPKPPQVEMQPTPQSYAPPTVVPRPKRKKRAWRIVGRIFVSIVKWAFALVLAVAVLAAGLVAYLTVTEYTPAEREKAQSGNRHFSATYDATNVLRIATLNIGYGGLGADADFFMDGGKSVMPESEEVVLENMSGIKRILSDIDADVMFLQEVDTDSKRSYGKNQWRQYEFEFPEHESAFALNYSCDYVPYPINWDFDFIGKVNSGLATFSRYDIASATRIGLPNSFSWPTRVANLKRCLLVTRLNLVGREQQLVLVNCHLEAYDDGEAKQAQTEQLMAFIEEEYNKGNYVIVGGDFNQTFPDSDAYPLRDPDSWAPGKLSKLKNGWRYAYDDSVPTCRLLDRPYNAATAQYYVIDGFILSPNVMLRRVQTIDEDFAFTDHNPVVLEVALR